MLAAPSPKLVSDIAAEIQAEEIRQGLQLADEQRRAVMTALTSKLCVITGGPGTGKTLIQRFLWIFTAAGTVADRSCAARLPVVQRAGWSNLPDFRP